MDVFGEQVLDAISKIKKRSKGPDPETIFKHILSNSASSICFNDVKEKLQELIEISKIEKRKINQGLDSYFINNSETGLIAEDQGIFGTQECTGRNITVGDPVETPTIKNANTPPLNEVHVEDFTVRFVEMKAFLMNEIFGLKTEIRSLKEILQNRGNTSPNTNDDNIQNLELQTYFLKQENSFIKIELQNKQEIINKILDLNCFQSKDECSINRSNKNDERLQELQTMLMENH